MKSVLLFFSFFLPLFFFKKKTKFKASTVSAEETAQGLQRKPATYNFSDQPPAVGGETISPRPIKREWLLSRRENSGPKEGSSLDPSVLMCNLLPTERKYSKANPGVSSDSIIQKYTLTLF